MKLLAIAGLLLSVGVTAGCSSAPGKSPLQQHKARALAELAALESTPLRSSADATITRSAELYVPLPAADLASLPDWYTKPIRVDASGISFAELLTDVFADQPVSLWFSQAELKQFPVNLRFTGNLGELLQRLADHTGWHYEVEANRVSWNRWRTAEFDVAFIAGATEFFMGNKELKQSGQQQNMAPGSTLSAAVAGSDQFSNFSDSATSVWQDLERALTMLLSEQGSSASIKAQPLC
ncbi:hypothetical protein [Pseudidiomarina halophila]|uniref:hypothetical protein n=1 Tax=Pseudidiomarina halophila TaxID=1449799 RepID=UPI0036227296